MVEQWCVRANFYDNEQMFSSFSGIFCLFDVHSSFFSLYCNCPAALASLNMVFQLRSKQIKGPKWRRTSTITSNSIHILSHHAKREQKQQTIFFIVSFEFVASIIQSYSRNFSTFIIIFLFFKWKMQLFLFACCLFFDSPRFSISSQFWALLFPVAVFVVETKEPAPNTKLIVQQKMMQNAYWPNAIENYDECINFKFGTNFYWPKSFISSWNIGLHSSHSSFKIVAAEKTKWKEILNEQN